MLFLKVALFFLTEQYKMLLPSKKKAKENIIKYNTVTWYLQSVELQTELLISYVLTYIIQDPYKHVCRLPTQLITRLVDICFVYPVCGSIILIFDMMKLLFPFSLYLPYQDDNLLKKTYLEVHFHRKMYLKEKTTDLIFNGKQRV